MKRVTEDELKKILADHIVWLETEGRDGKRANLKGANLADANLKGANLADANLYDANLYGANLAGTDLTDANLQDANLQDANLKGANLKGANLYGAKLEHAYLPGADLEGADLEGAKLKGADLYDANLQDAKLEDAYLPDANLEGANLEGANLAGATLEDANLFRATLAYAKLEDANLEGANLKGANLAYASLFRATLAYAKLEDANLKGANLADANLYDANLYGANLAGADLAGANLADANLQDANLQDANLAGAILPTPVTARLAYGRKTRALSKLKKQALPLKAGSFKKLFPVEFEQVKSETKGADFTPELLEALIRRYGMTWAVTSARYESHAQRLCPGANDVLLLNVDISDEAYTDEQREILTAVKEMSQRSGHPVKKGKDFFTVGWVRYCDFPDRILVEEVQSDVGGVRKGLKDPEFVGQLASSGLSAGEIDAAMALMQPFADRFYEDALGLIFDMAEEQGKKVEMLDYAQKKQFGSPRNVYTDLPKSMGMKLGPSEAMPDLGQVWTYTPNRRKRRR